MTNWQPIETVPLDRQVLLWWVGGKKLPKAPPSCAMGQVSSHVPGEVWDGYNYLSASFYTHWAPLPDGPANNDNGEEQRR